MRLSYLTMGNETIKMDHSEKVLELNQLIEGHYPGSDKRQYVVYEIVKISFNYRYKLIDIENKKFHETDYPLPLRHANGVGIYYDDVNPQFMSEEGLAELLEEVKEIEEKRKEQESIEKEKIEAIKKIGRERLEKIMPEDVQGVIIAYMQDNSSDSSYGGLGYSSTRTVILGFSKTKRNSFAELRKVAVNFEETKHLAEYNQSYEHREGYTGGSDYYLAQNRYNGWAICKDYCRTRKGFIDIFAYDAGCEDNIYVNPPTETQNTPVETDTSNLTLELVEYSEKSVALFGDTKPIKDILSKQLHGLFKSNLTYNGERKAGWIFSKKQEPKVRNFLNL